MTNKFLTISDNNEIGEVIGIVPSDLIDAFVPYGAVVKSGYMGEKGQWSWNQKEETLLFCIASNTWVNLYTLENIIKDNFIKHNETIEMFVPVSNITSSNSKGVKGQWSFSERHYYKCIATNTWIRHEVEKLF